MRRQRKDSVKLKKDKVQKMGEGKGNISDREERPP